MFGLLIVAGVEGMTQGKGLEELSEAALSVTEAAVRHILAVF